MSVLERLDCIVCSQGLLEVRRRNDTGQVYAECQECMTGYSAPDRTLTFRTEDAEWSSSEVTLAEALQAGWPSPYSDQ